MLAVTAGLGPLGPASAVSAGHSRSERAEPAAELGTSPRHPRLPPPRSPRLLSRRPALSPLTRPRTHGWSRGSAGGDYTRWAGPARPRTGVTRVGRARSTGGEPRDTKSAE